LPQKISKLDQHTIVKIYLPQGVKPAINTSLDIETKSQKHTIFAKKRLIKKQKKHKAILPQYN